MYNYCVLCNPEENWLEVEFRSENDEPINKLKVTITNPSTLQTHKMITNNGYCLFGNIAAGEWVISVETDNLLDIVEQYSSRKEEISPVKKRADKELGAAHKNSKKYSVVSIGDLWQSPPEDEFLIENHAPIMNNYDDSTKGFRAYHNTTFVLEIKALRSYIPMIVETDDFNLVNSYTFALLSQLAYASKEKSEDKQSSTDVAGCLNIVIQQLKLRQRPSQSSVQKVDWILQEVPYSQALKYKYYTNTNIGVQGYLLYNDDIAIVGVRGTEVSWEAQAGGPSDKNTLSINKIKNGIDAILNSPAIQDGLLSDLDAAQIAPAEFGGTSVHRGFYQYAMALIKPLKDNKNLIEHKKLYVCGHSLGGTAALLLSARFKDTFIYENLRLYTYGMPRAGTRTFVERYKDILHYRHVNNHDLVPQVPTVWANTDITEGFEASDIFSSGVTLGQRMLKDDDNDNYLHHGKLSQLFTYDTPNQVLLTPRQTQITMLDMAKLATNDSVSFITGLGDASIVEHFLGHYIPNLHKQLKALSQESLYDNYQDAINYLTDKINTQQQAYLKVEHALYNMRNTNSLGDYALKQEIALHNKLLNNYRRVKQELTNIMNNPERLPLSRLLLASQVLPDDIKEQLQ